MGGDDSKQHLPRAERTLIGTARATMIAALASLAATGVAFVGVWNQIRADDLSRTPIMQLACRNQYGPADHSEPHAAYLIGTSPEPFVFDFTSGVPIYTSDGELSSSPFVYYKCALSNLGKLAAEDVKLNIRVTAWTANMGSSTSTEQPIEISAIDSGGSYNFMLVNDMATQITVTFPDNLDVTRLDAGKSDPNMRLFIDHQTRQLEQQTLPANVKPLILKTPAPLPTKAGGTPLHQG